MITLESMSSFQATLAQQMNSADLLPSPHPFSRESLNDVAALVLTELWTKYERKTWGRGA